MNLFFYLQTFILDYFFIVILSDHIFLLCFIKTQPFVKGKPVKTEKNTGTIAFRFRQVLLYHYGLATKQSNNQWSGVIAAHPAPKNSEYKNPFQNYRLCF